MCDAHAVFIDDMLLCSSVGKAIIRDAENIRKPMAVQSGRCLLLVALEQLTTQLVSCPLLPEVSEHGNKRSSQADS